MKREALAAVVVILIALVIIGASLMIQNESPKNEGNSEKEALNLTDLTNDHLDEALAELENIDFSVYP